MWAGNAWHWQRSQRPAPPIGTAPGVVKFAQVVGVFPGPRFDDAEGADAGEADVELLGWEELRFSRLAERVHQSLQNWHFTCICMCGPA